MTEYKHLFQMGKIGSLYLKNRIIMAPLGSRLTTENGAVTEDMIEFYSQRARGGAGAITIEAMGIDYPLAVGKPNHVRFNSEAYVPGHAKLVEKIHECGAKAIAMLWHAGINKGPLEGQMPVGPSAILNPNTGLVPRELTTQEVKDLVQMFADAALRAQTCGYDAVNLHGAHGYLISSFVSAATNQRTDEYGGSFENRIRFAIEIVQAIRSKVRKDYPLLMRINGDDFIAGGITPDQAVKFAQALEKAGLDAIDVSAGVYGSLDTMIEPIQYEEGWKLYLAEEIKKHVSIPVIGVGVIHSPQVADQAIAEGKIDFAAVGRELLCEPQWANKALAGDDHFPRCVGCNACFERIGKNLPIRCAVNALAGRELHVPQPAVEAKKVAVVGAGAAGVSAALTAAGRGHEVTLFEKAERIGGQLILAGAPPRKDKILDYIEYLEGELRRSSVKLVLGHTFEAAEAEVFDEIILAVGAACKDMPVEGSDGKRITAWEALRLDQKDLEGRSVVVVGGGSVGCEAALYIKEKGAAQVAVVELRNKIAADMDNISRMKLMDELAEDEIELFPGMVLSKVEDGKAVLASLDTADDAKTRMGVNFPCDLVVIAVGSGSQRGLADELYAQGCHFTLVGDAQTIGKIGDAVRGGFDAAAPL